jgi:hypothetical protein
MDGPLSARAFWWFGKRIRCGHVSGLCARYIQPLALREYEVGVPNHGFVL